MKQKKHIVLLLFLVSGMSLIHSFEPETAQLHLKILGQKQAEPPEIFGKDVLFTYQGDAYTRHVGIAFAHEQFVRIHTLIKNERNVFILAFPIPMDTDTLTYRFVVDGLWTPDPNAPKEIRDRNGILLSQTDVPFISSRQHQNPFIDKEGNAEFTLHWWPGKTIYLIGSFSNWDPYMYKLSEHKDNPGLYTVTLRVTEGRHLYYFFVDGMRVKDPVNPLSVPLREGYDVSVFTMR